MIRAVIDTHVLVSGLLSRLGNESLILLAVHQGLVRPCLSAPILLEYEAVLARPKFAFDPSQITALMGMLRRQGEMITAPVTATTSPDPDDAQFIHCAEAAAAEFIVTGNKRHFPGAPYGAIRVVNAGELLERITAGL